jgi:hypothetical protein
MVALDGWTLAPLLVALSALVLIALRARELLFRAALDPVPFARELSARILAGDLDAARALALRLRPAWAAELALRALPARHDPEALEFELQEGYAAFSLASQRGLLAIRSLGRLAFPLALAVAIVQLGRGFDPDPRLALGSASAANEALGRGILAMATGMATSIASQVSVGVLVRAAQQRLAEVRAACDSFLIDAPE